MSLFDPLNNLLQLPISSDTHVVNSGFNINVWIKPGLTRKEFTLLVSQWVVHSLLVLPLVKVTNAEHVASPEHHVWLVAIFCGAFKVGLGVMRQAFQVVHGES